MAGMHPGGVDADEGRGGVAIGPVPGRSGGGGFLIRRLVKWFRERPILKLCVFTLESGADPKIGKLLVKLGLKRELPNYVGVK